MIKLALLRHGHTEWNREGRIQGRTDIALDADARALLSTLCLPAPWDRAALQASPLSRARDTAMLVAGRKPEMCDALTEMDWGTWEGRKAADVHADPVEDHRPVETWGWDYAAPGGETPAQVRDRLLPWLATLDTDTVAVCHIGVMRVLLALGTGWGFDGPAPFQIKRNRLYLLTLEDNALRLQPDPLRLPERLA